MENFMGEKTFFYDIIVSENPGVDGHYILLDSRFNDIYTSKDEMREEIEKIYEGPYDLIFNVKEDESLPF